MCAALLLMALRIRFRRSRPDGLNFLHGLHHEWMFEIIFSSDDDEVVADAVCVQAAGMHQETIGLCARLLAGRIERGAPFSPRLRRTIANAIDYSLTWGFGQAGFELEIARLLNHLDIHADEVKCWHD